jgi:adenine deaminase
LNQLLLRELHKGGVTLVLGTDAGPMGMGLVPGFSLHDELRIVVENGLTPYEALRTATVNAAEVIKKRNGKATFGTVEAGKKADRVLIGGNPFDDINNAKKIHGVMASGQWLDKQTLQKMITPGIPGKPQIGTYTIEVTGGREKGLACDIQAVVKTIPLPEVQYFTPLNEATLKSGHLAFLWKTIKSKKPLYYRLEINKHNGGRVYSTGYIKNMQSHTVPDGVLKDGQSYRWRVRITDSDNWVNVQNRSHSEWQIFHLR